MSRQRIQVALRRSDWPVSRDYQAHMLRALGAVAPHVVRRDHNVLILADEELDFDARVPNDMERRARRLAEACVHRLLDPRTVTGQRMHAHLHTPAVDVDTGAAQTRGVVYVELADPLTDDEWSERALAFAQGADSRLGADSRVRTLPVELVRRIVDG